MLDSQGPHDFWQRPALTSVIGDHDQLIITLAGDRKAQSNDDFRTWCNGLLETCCIRRLMLDTAFDLSRIHLDALDLTPKSLSALIPSLWARWGGSDGTEA